MIILTSIIFIYGCLFAFVFKKPFLLGNDQWFQYNIFYKEWIRLVINFIKTGNLPMYSWNMYLGTDFYSAMGYYCTGDIFLPILLILHDHILFALIIETIICVYISASLMFILLEKFEVKKEINKIFISLIYAFGGMASLFFGNYMFHRFYAFLPLLFIGLLNYFNNKKVGTFIVATAILFLQNYYFMYPTLIFLFIFSLMYEIKSKKQIKVILKDFFILLGCLLLGFMISAVIALPSMMSMLNNNKVGVLDDKSLLWPGLTYIGLLLSLISFNPVEITGNIFQTVGNNHGYWYSLFITIIPLLSCLGYFFKNENRCELITFIILVLFIIFRPLSSVMHGLSNPAFRWLFLFELFVLIFAAKGLDEFDYKKVKPIYYVYSLIYISLVIFLYVEYGIFDVCVYHYVIIIISLILSIIIFILLDKKRNIAIVLSILELITFEGYYLYRESKDSGIGDESAFINGFSELYENDSDTFRIHTSYIDQWPASILNLNKSIEYGYMGTSAYNSMYEQATYKFNELSNSMIVGDFMDWVMSVDDVSAGTSIGAKYYVTERVEDLPEGLNYEWVGNIDYLNVYINLDYQGYGYTSNKLKYTSDFTNTKDFIDYILVDDNSIDIDKYNNTNISYTKLNITSKYDNYLEANITLEEDNILLIPIPNNKGWTIKVNDKEVTPISVNGGFIGLELSKGYNQISMNFMSPYFKEGVIISLFGILISLSIVIIRKRNTA